MTNITIALIKELRKRTNVSITKCKEALIQAHGNIELAVNNIKQSGLEIALKKSHHKTSAGLIAIQIKSNKQYGVIVEIKCETDFVAKDSTFQTFAKTVIMTALNESINNINELKIRFEHQRAHLVTVIGENISICRFSVLTGNFLDYYVHKSKIGAIVVANKYVNDELIKYIAMHIVAQNPQYINVHDISTDIINYEHRAQMNIAMQSGKSHKILEKIVEGRMNKFINEIVLTKQNFIMDTNKTVGEILSERDIIISNFVRFELGDNTQCK